MMPLLDLRMRAQMTDNRGQLRRMWMLQTMTLADIAKSLLPKRTCDAANQARNHASKPRDAA